MTAPVENPDAHPKGTNTAIIWAALIVTSPFIIAALIITAGTLWAALTVLAIHPAKDNQPCDHPA